MPRVTLVTLTWAESKSGVKRDFHYHKTAASEKHSITADQFKEEGILKSTIYNMVAKGYASGEITCRSPPGRPPVKSSPKTRRKVEKAFTRHPYASVRAVARRLRVAKPTVSDIKLHQRGRTAQTMKNASKYLAGQEQRAKTECRKIYEKVRKKVLVIDDETWITNNPSQLPRRGFVNARDHSQLVVNQKFKQATRFPKKIFDLASN